ncbi:hypothetical protein [Fulvimarina manganoxydans]|nr:hypothetical protein [Fulvimarina manganoxydans]
MTSSLSGRSGAVRSTDLAEKQARLAAERRAACFLIGGRGI